MKIAYFKENISPDVGAFLAGYNTIDESVMKLDDLYAIGLCIDDGRNRVLLVSFDLLGLDEWFVRENRKKCADLLGVPESAVLFTCTHTHCGPHTRSLAGRPEMLNRKYMDRLAETLIGAVGKLGDFREAVPCFHSILCDENQNRRYTSGDNRAIYTPFRRQFVPMRTGFADQELGTLMFLDPATDRPVYVVANYAAHPLAGHTPGPGALRTSAAYPGALRDYVTANTGAECMFVAGAQGDLVPREDEMGDEAFRSLGIRLGKQVIGGIVDASRSKHCYALDDARVASCISTFTAPLRRKYRDNPKTLPAEYLGHDEAAMEIQCVAVGDVAFVGVPGEVCCELGAEIKWHSPFRRTFIAYNSTAYMSYICPANFLVSGGYESMSQRISSRGGLAMVNTAVDALCNLREEIFPSADEPYPDTCGNSLVNIERN
ncbi:MAG: hypothetical protein MJ025_03990 [Victivallaceae bacterium]|nr:hypothetical protein [Victivallaceae bacterium]